MKKKLIIISIILAALIFRGYNNVLAANPGDTLDKITIGEYVSFGGSVWRKARYYQHDQHVTNEHGYFIRLFDGGWTSQYHPTSNNFATSTINTVALSNFYNSITNDHDMKYAIRNNSWFVTDQLGGGTNRIYTGKVALPSYHEVYNNTLIFGTPTSPYFWTRTPNATNNAAVYVFASSYTNSISMVHHSIYAVLPSVRLSTYGTTILSGAGTSASPYVLQYDPTAAPPIALIDPGLDLVASPTRDLIIYGEINYSSPGKTLTVSATIDGITKSTSFDSPVVSQDWQLSWTYDEVGAGIYTNIVFTLNDGTSNFTDTYVGNAIFDKTPPTCGTWDPSQSPWKKVGGTFYTLANSSDLGGSGIVTAGGTCTTGNNHGDICSITINDYAGNSTTCDSPPNRVESILPSIIFDNVSNASSYYGITSLPSDPFSVQDSESGLASNGIRYAWTSNASNPFNATCSSGGTTVSVSAGDTNLIANSASVGKPSTTGIHYLHVCSIDQATNVRKSESIYYYDATSPTSGSISYADGFVTNGDLIISVDPGMDIDSGLSTNDGDYLLEYQRATLSAGVCGSYGGWTDANLSESATATTYNYTASHGYCYQFRYSVKDAAGNSTTYNTASIVKVVTEAPVAGCLLSPGTNPNYQHISASTIYYNPAQAGSFTITASSSDVAAGIEKVSFPTLASDFSPSATDISVSPYALTYSWTTAATTSPGDKQATIYSNAGLSDTCDFRVEKDITPPQLGSITYANHYLNDLSIQPIVTVSDGTDTQSGINTLSRQLQRASAPLSNNSCGSFSSFADVTFSGIYPNFTDTQGIADHTCYQYRYLVSDQVSNQATYATSNIIKVDTTHPTITLTNINYSSSSIFYHHGSRTLYYQPTPSSKEFTVNVSAQDLESSIEKVIFPGSGDIDITPTIDQEATSSPYLQSYILQTNVANSYPALPITAYNYASLSSSTDFNLITDQAGPNGVVVFCPSDYSNSGTYNVVGSSGTDTLSGVNTTASFFQRSVSNLSNDACDPFTSYDNHGLANDSNLAQTGLSDGCYSYRYYTRDNVGNTTISSTCTVKVDSVDPLISATNSSSTWFSTPRSATIQASDSLSGISEIRYSYHTFQMDATCSVGGTLVSNNTTLNPPKGDITLHLCAKDNAGNVSTWNGTYRYDDATPVISYINTSTSSNYYDATDFNSLTDFFTVRESIIGLASNGIRYLWTDSISDPTGMTNSTCNSGNLVTVTDGTTALISHPATIGKPTSSGTYYLHLCAFNTIGNITKSTSAYYLDYDDPTTPTQAVSPTATVMQPQVMTISFSATDAHSGIDRYLSCYTNDGSVCTPNTSGTTLQLSDVGEYRVCGQAVDKVGHLSPVSCSGGSAYVIEVSNNTALSFALTNPSTNHIVTTHSGLTISGTISDLDHGQTLTISATIGGIYKSTTLVSPANNANWSLKWTYAELAAGTYTNITFSATDSFSSVSANYTGDILVDKTAPSLSFNNSSDSSSYYSLKTYEDITHPVSTQDNLSGLQTFRYYWSNSSDHPSGITPNDCSQGTLVSFSSGTIHGVSSTAAMSRPVHSGIHYLHACAVDTAGNIAKGYTAYYLDAATSSENSNNQDSDDSDNAQEADKKNNTTTQSSSGNANAHLLRPAADSSQADLVLESDGSIGGQNLANRQTPSSDLSSSQKNTNNQVNNRQITKSNANFLAIFAGGLFVSQPQFLPSLTKILAGLGISPNIIHLIETLSTQIFPYITLLALLPIGLFIIIIPRPCGFVFDSRSKQAISHALVAVIKEGQFITASITNKYGLYTGFKLLPGEYQLIVSSIKHIFPSNQPRVGGQTKANHYLGEKFYISSEFDKMLTYQIPLDFDYTNYPKTAPADKYIFSWRAIRFLMAIVNSLGLIWSISFGIIIFFTLIYPIWLNLIVLGVYLFGLFRRITVLIKKSNIIGHLTDEDNQALSDVVISLKLLAHDRLVLTTVTDKQGKFSIYAHPKHKYYLSGPNVNFIESGKKSELIPLDMTRDNTNLKLIVKEKD